MTIITTDLIKKLREKTNAGMMDCKNALTECKGDMESAVTWLRKKGLSAALKKSGRATSEGLVSVLSKDDKKAVILEINTETDFVARNEQFQNFAYNVSEQVLLKGYDSITALLSDTFGNVSYTVEDELSRMISVVGENMKIHRMGSLFVSNGIVATYVHNTVSKGLGKIGVLVVIESSTKHLEKLKDWGEKLAMHIAAAQPKVINIENLDPSLVKKEKTIFAEQFRSSGKPAHIIEKMLESRVNKFYEEVVLNEQAYIVDNKTKMSSILDRMGKDLEASVRIAEFIRFSVGEEIQ
ncbi:MAG: translation elongation factor Ts [Alphaproteobacteria bacterium]